MRRRYLIPRSAGLLLSLAAIACDPSDGGPTSGDMVVVIATTGTGLDPNGYQVEVTGASSVAATINDTVTFSGLSAGAHDVQLSGVAATCVGGAVVHATIPEGGTDTVSFPITCTATTGLLAIRLTTTGVALDPDGYSVTIDGGAPVGVAANATTVAVSKSVGIHSVALSGVVMNCTPTVAGPYAPNVGPAEQDTLTIAVTCAWPRVLVRITPSAGVGGVALLNPDGTNEVSLLVDSTGAHYTSLAWAGSGTQTFAFEYLGSGAVPPSGIGRFSIGDPAPTTVRRDSLNAQGPRWNASEDTIAFVQPDSATGRPHAYLQAVAGGARVPLTPDSLAVVSLDWDTSSGRIAFIADGPDHAARLYIIQPDGSGLTRVTPDSITSIGGSPRWRPGTDQISIYYSQSLWTIGAASHDLTHIPVNGYAPDTPAWSPDGGEFLSFAQNLTSGAGVLIRCTATGTLLAEMTRPGPSSWTSPDWH